MVTEKIDVVDTPQSGAVAIRQDTSAEALIAQAIDKNVPVETMEKLLAMRRELKDEQAREAFYRALAKFQSECPVVVKGKKAGTGNYTYNYAPMDSIIAQVRDPLERNGFSYTVQTRYEQDPPAQVAICIVHHVEGHSEQSEFRAPIDSGNMNNIQKNASSVTYAKRYAFCNALGILTGDEDNDAQVINGTDKQPPQKNGGHHDLEKQILKDISDPHFAAEIEFEDKQVDLDAVRIQVNEWLNEGHHSLGKITEAADRIARMLLIAKDEDSKDGAAFVDPKAEGQLNDDDVVKVFQGELVDTTETEGNLSG